MKNPVKVSPFSAADLANWSETLFAIRSRKELEEIALGVFRYQYENNAVYRAFTDQLAIPPESVKALTDIPFLPVEGFKTRPIRTGIFEPERVFRSSGTTGQQRAVHEVADAGLYGQVHREIFRRQYGTLEDYAVLALLPSYLEREDASLVAMADSWIRSSDHPASGFYLDDRGRLTTTLRELEEQQQPVLLLGVSFALLDLAEQFPFRLEHTIVMETGGMKGRREEMVRGELQERLKAGFGVEHIHSEYGMTELLSQAYSQRDGLFRSSPWLHPMVRELEDPMAYLPPGRSGGLNIIDLANVHSCAFLATQDIGRLHDDGSFEVLGRADNSDVRGCNLMVIE